MSVGNIGLDFGKNKFYDELINGENNLERSYNKDNVLVGRTINGKNFSIDMTTGVRITLIGIVGSGKTWNIRSIMERFHKTGAYHIAILPDVKNDFPSSRKVAPKLQYKFYATGEKPQGFPILSFKPKFFKTFKISIPKGEFDLTTGFRMGDLTYNDIKDIFKFHELPDLQKAFVDELAINIQRGKVKINHVLDLEEVIEKSDLQVQSKRSLLLKLKSFFSMNFFCEPAYNPVTALKKGFIVSLNLERFDDVDKKGGAPQIAVSIWQRLIANAKKDRILKKRVLLILDEANRFIPANRDTSIKLDVLENVELLRSYQVSYLFAYQTIKSVPDPILQNSRYIFVPCNAGVETFKKAFMSTGIFRKHANQLGRYISKVKDRMIKFNIHSWLVFDRSKGRIDVVEFLSPMSKHDTKS